MSSPTLDQIQAGIKRALDGIDGLRAYATEPDQAPGVSSPIAYPRLVDWAYDEEFQTFCDEVATLYHFDIWVLVDKASGLNRAQTQLNPFVSPTGRRSVKAALESDWTLNGCVNYVRLIGGGQYGTADIAGTSCLAASCAGST